MSQEKVKKLQVFGLLSEAKANEVFATKKELEEKTTPTESDVEVIAALSEIGLVDPVVSHDGKLYTDNNGNVYVL